MFNDFIIFHHISSILPYPLTFGGLAMDLHHLSQRYSTVRPGFREDAPETWKKLSDTETGRYYDAHLFRAWKGFGPWDSFGLAKLKHYLGSAIPQKSMEYL